MSVHSRHGSVRIPSFSFFSCHTMGHLPVFEGTDCARVRSQQGVRECEGPPHNYSSSFPAGVHAPGFRLSAKVNKVEGCAWLYAHQSPDRSHSQRISNRCEGFITFLSLSAERGCDHLSGEQVRRKIPVFVKRGCGANTR